MSGETKSEYGGTSKKRGSYAMEPLTHLPITNRQSYKKHPRHAVAVLYSPQSASLN